MPTIENRIYTCRWVTQNFQQLATALSTARR
jgi:hypothetical protein